MLIDNITHTSSESRITNFLVWHGMGSFLKPKIQRNPWKVFISSKLLFIHHKQCSIQWCSSDKLLIMNNILAFDIMISFCLINANSFEHCNASMEGGFWDLLWVIKKIWRMAVEGGVMPIIKCAMWMAISSASILMDLICFFHSFVVLCCTEPKCLHDLNVSKCLQMSPGHCCRY